MSGKITLTIIKPEAVAQKNTGAILSMISDAGFRIRAMKMVKLSEEEAGIFYQVHKGKPFYEKLLAYMSSGPVVAAILENENAVESFRKLIGSTNPVDADEGTIRKRFGASLESNAIHGSDSDENATIESNFFFSAIERVAVEEGSL